MMQVAMTPSQEILDACVAVQAQPDWAVLAGRVQLKVEEGTAEPFPTDKFD